MTLWDWCYDYAHFSRWGNWDTERVSNHPRWQGTQRWWEFDHCNSLVWCWAPQLGLAADKERQQEWAFALVTLSLPCTSPHIHTLYTHTPFPPHGVVSLLLTIKFCDYNRIDRDSPSAGLQEARELKCAVSPGTENDVQDFCSHFKNHVPALEQHKHVFCFVF